MKKFILITILLQLSLTHSFANVPYDLEQLFLEIRLEVKNATVEYNDVQADFGRKLSIVNLKLKDKTLSTDQLLQLLLEKDEIKDIMDGSGIKYNFKLASIRYRKGIDLIKLLYEKILDLDHHFTALNTYQHIANISNPNSYPQFVQSKEALKKSVSSKSSIEMPQILQSNIYVNLVTSVVSTFFGDNKKGDRKEKLDDISCILDFTTTMHSDLNIIYYETEFLIDNNKSLNEEINKLFKDYTKVINYKTGLNECRNSDDWDGVDEQLSSFIVDLEKMLKEDAGSPKYRKGIKAISNLEFSLDKVFGFLNKYSNFVDSGSKYYNKFYKIINNYKNVDKCASELPVQYETLRSDIKLSIEKFKVAYDIGELKGSGLRDLIYGVPEAYN